MRASDSSRCSPSVSKANFVRTNMASLPKPFRQADFSPITVPVPPILSFQLMRRMPDLLQPEDAAGVVAQDGRPILRGQLQTVENLDLLFQDVVPVAAPHRGVSAEEDAPGAERAQSIAEDLFQRWPARVVLPPVVGPRGVHAHVFGMVGQEQRFPEEPRPEVCDEERYFWKLLHRR